MAQLPCDNEGVCLICKTTPSPNETLTCSTCVTPWHIACLAIAAQSSSSNVWECPDCSDMTPAGAPAAGEKSELVTAIQAIEADKSLTDNEKARKRQELLSGKAVGKEDEEGRNEVADMIRLNFNCCVCFQLLVRPVTPRINSALVAAIRMARMSSANASGGQLKISHYVHNQHRPDKAYTTDRAKRNGMANAASGKIFVTTSSDHFGPITAENDPVRHTGVLVGECWDLRMDCRQWGIHYPHVSGIAGQAKYGAQSVVLSGGYEDDEDHGEWFLYTGSLPNVSTGSGMPFVVNLHHVLRNHTKRSDPVMPLKLGCGMMVSTGSKSAGEKLESRYLFVRCDNEPAPWTSDEHGDRPRPLPTVKELKGAIDIFERSESPSWDYAEEDNVWKWKKPPPASQKPVRDANPEDIKNARVAIRKAETAASKGKLLKEFSCLLCKNVMTLPLTTPCAHNFCKACLEGKYAGQSFTRERSRGGRTLRSQKNAMICPACPTDISDFLQNAQINRELQQLIEKLQESNEEADAPEESPEASYADADKENEVSNCEAETKIVEDMKRKEADSKSPLMNKKRKVDEDNSLKSEDAS
ncbi:hypothetical protein AgCh_014038 [Apium graveolens]